MRPLNSTERSSYAYNRCLKQESAQCVTWIGQPETRFTFDHVACETVNQVCSRKKQNPMVSFPKLWVGFDALKFESMQEMLFRVAGLPMVENCLSGYNSCMFAYGQVGFALRILVGFCHIDVI